MTWIVIMLIELILSDVNGIGFTFDYLWRPWYIDYYSNSSKIDIYCKATPGWDSCYQAIGEYSNQDEMKKACQRIGAVLAAPFSDGELQMLCRYAKLKGLTSLAKLNIRNIYKNETFYYETTNTPMTIGRWAPDEPDEPASDCIAFGINTQGICELYNVGCHGASETFCQMKDSTTCTFHYGGCWNMCLMNQGTPRCACQIGKSNPRLVNHCIDNSTCGRNSLCHIEGLDHVCRCFYGFYYNGHHCIDIDECAVNNGNCSQICVNMEGGYRCECVEGELKDGVTCQAPARVANSFSYYLPCMSFALSTLSVFIYYQKTDTSKYSRL